MTTAEQLSEAYTAAALALVLALGHDEMKSLRGQLDFDTVPAAAVNAGRSALDLLLVAVGLLDASPDSPTIDMDADEYLRRLNEKAT